MTDSDFVKLIAVGDIMLGDHPICIGNGVGSLIKEKGSKFIFKKVSSFLRKGDITFGNLECVLSDLNIDNSNIDSVSLRAPESSIKGLNYAGFDLMSLANNHILEHGQESFIRTIDLLNKNDIKPVGVSKNPKNSRELVVINRNDISFGFLAYCTVPDKTAYRSVENFSEIVEDVENMKDDIDNLIVSLHWGEEYIRKPSSEQVRLGHAIIDAGADLILGHHPHVLQGVERYNKGMIAYSLGNFVFDMWQRKMRESMILSIDFSKKGIEEFEIIPIIIDRNTFQPSFLEGIEKQKLIEKITRDFLERMKENEYSQEVRKCNQQYHLDLLRHLIFNFYKYKPRYLCQIILNSFKN